MFILYDTYYVLGAVLGAGDLAVNEKGMESTFLVYLSSI